MRCRRGGTPRGSRTVVVLYGYIVTYGYIFACVPPDNRITALPGRMYEATRHHTEKDCGERRKDRRMRHEGRRHNAIRHGPSCLGSPPPVVPPLPTARRASAPHRPSCAMVWHPERPSPAKPRPNIRLSPTPPTAVLRVVSHVNTVAFYRRSSGGAAKADRWAALNPLRGRRTNRAARHHRE